MNNQTQQNGRKQMSPLREKWLRLYILAFFIGIWFVLTAIPENLLIAAIFLYAVVLAAAISLVMWIQSLLENQDKK